MGLTDDFVSHGILAQSIGGGVAGSLGASTGALIGSAGGSGQAGSVDVTIAAGGPVPSTGAQSHCIFAQSAGAPTVTGCFASGRTEVAPSTTSTELDKTSFDVAASVDVYTRKDAVLRPELFGSFADNTQNYDGGLTDGYGRASRSLTARRFNSPGSR